jgi:hypothetical protein
MDWSSRRGPVTWFCHTHTHTLPPTHPHKTQGHGSVKTSYDERFTCGEPVQELHQSGMERQRVSEKQAD